MTLKEKLDESEEEIRAELRQLVRQEIAAYAVPDVIQVREIFVVGSAIQRFNIAVVNLQLCKFRSIIVFCFL